MITLFIKSVKSIATCTMDTSDTDYQTLFICSIAELYPLLAVHSPLVFNTTEGPRSLLVNILVLHRVSGKFDILQPSRSFHNNVNIWLSLTFDKTVVGIIRQTFVCGIKHLNATAFLYMDVNYGIWLSPKLKICVAGRKCVRNVMCIPYRTHNPLLRPFIFSLYLAPCKES